MPDIPESEEAEVPAYMVSFGDMITLLLTFFILLVALADTQSAGLVGAGKGPLVQHLNAKGEPGILPGHLNPRRLAQKRDAWWIPDQEGDPDQLEVVRDKLQRELKTKFKEGEAQIYYEKDHLLMRLPTRIHFKDGVPIIEEETREILNLVARSARMNNNRYVKIHGDVGKGGSFEQEWLESAQLCELVYSNLKWRGVSTKRMSIWSWGSTRRVARGPGLNTGVTIEIFDHQERKRARDF